MTKRADYDQWVIDWITAEKQAGKKCFDVKKVVNAYYVYYQTTRFNPETRKREKVSAYIGKLVKDVGLVEAHTKKEEPDIVSSIRYGLGVDTGGTFTDAVIVDLDDFTVIAKSKSPTTHRDLSIGLHNAVDNVFSLCDIDPSEITLVGVSTTLATNSVLEGHGGEVGLIFIGWNPNEPVHFGEKHQAFVKGGFDGRGKVVQSMELEEVKAAIRKVSKDVDAIAISGLYSIVNSSQEEKVKKLVEEMTGLPTVAGYELSSTLGIDLRAETAVLNGKLIPTVSRFFDNLEQTFRAKGITAPIMAYKGDGSVMSLERARLYPVETVFSGPAASSMGGKILSGFNDFVVVDIGGTSTDIAIVEDGMPQIQFEGATIGDWRTRVKAVDMFTTAIGGDSKISVEESKFIIGPRRVRPLCLMTMDYPQIVSEIEYSNIYDYYVLDGLKEGDVFNERQAKIVNAMKDRGPLTALEIKSKTEGLWVIEDDLNELVASGKVTEVSLTPTDVLVFQKKFSYGNFEGARSGIVALANRFGMGELQVADVLMDEIRTKISEAILTRFIDDEFRNWKSPETAKFLRRMASSKKDKGFEMMPRIDVPIIGIGAPTQYLMEGIGKRLGTKALFNKDSDVGNAVGAVCSKMVESLSATVTPTKDYRYKVDMPYLGPSYYSKIDTAVGSAQNSLKSFLTMKLEKERARNVNVTFKVKTFTAVEGGTAAWDDGDLARTVNRIEVIGRAIGDPPEDGSL